MAEIKFDWDEDTEELTGDEKITITFEPVEGEADRKITLEDIKSCAKFFNGAVDNNVGLTDEFSIAIFLALNEESRQRGELVECSLLDTIPIMHKWLTTEALDYLTKRGMEEITDV